MSVLYSPTGASYISCAGGRPEAVQQWARAPEEGASAYKAVGSFDGLFPLRDGLVLLVVYSWTVSAVQMRLGGS